jgi:hypothetical protein
VSKSLRLHYSICRNPWALAKNVKNLHAVRSNTHVLEVNGVSCLRCCGLSCAKELEPRALASFPVQVCDYRSTALSGDDPISHLTRSVNLYNTWILAALSRGKTLGRVASTAFTNALGT